DAVLETLLETMDTDEIRAAAETLDADEIADLAPDLPPEVMEDVLESLDQEEREHVRTVLSYPEDTVGALMDFDLVKVREDVALEVVLRYLRRFEALPDHTDKLYVVDREDRLRGILTLESLLINDPERLVAEVMQAKSLVTFHPEDDADEAAATFERYDLISAPVIDAEGRLIARLTVADMVDRIREESEAELLSQAGLREEEDIFA
ncbi:MAG: CBS domain-containing protein, partial [Burkholderiaceae bacterium]|nr:CBS domain-containing protein [Burkholderiaceae bacterium]